MATSKDENETEGPAKVMVEAVQKSSDVLKQQMAGLTDANLEYELWGSSERQSNT